MRILFATDAVDSVSTQLNAPNYAGLNEIEGVNIDFYNHNYAEYDVVLFMGYDPRITETRAANPSIKIGVIDIRPPSLEKALGADFVIANGLEMQDWLYNYFENVFIYPIYPRITSPLKEHTRHSPLIIGYHGNKHHLAAVQPHLSAALEALSQHHPLEFWAIYDIRSLGEMPYDLCDAQKVKMRYIQWKEDVYDRVLSQVDIGVVPNLIPLKDESLAKNSAGSYSSVLPTSPSDYLVRFKKTTNAGRIYVFSQLGIPVVAGISPSAAQAIRHEISGYLAFDSSGWYHGLKKLVDSAELRAQMGRCLHDDFQNEISPDVLNRRLVEFIRALPSFPVAPPRFHREAPTATMPDSKRKSPDSFFDNMKQSIKRAIKLLK